MDIILLVRLSHYRYVDHFNTIRELDARVHLLTDTKPREIVKHSVFTVNIVPKDSQIDIFYTEALKLQKKYQISAVITFIDPDIILAAQLAQFLNVPGLDLNAARIARDKNKQRSFLKQHNISIPIFLPIEKNTIVNEKFLINLPFPIVVKPTQAALSAGVYLARNFDELNIALAKIKMLTTSNKCHYYEAQSKTFALLEEFLPGDEVTLDAVIIDGAFVLGGIHNKRKNMGPTFEEDLYSLPYKHPELETELVKLASGICAALKLKNAMFNGEFRQDKNGYFKVVEFSIRFSAGFCYRHIKMVYGIDMVSLYFKSLMNISINIEETTRKKPVITSCTKWIFRTGKLLKNSIGGAYLSPYFEDYILLADTGAIVGHIHGINALGRLSLIAPLKSLADIAELESKAIKIENLLDVQIEPI